MMLGIVAILLRKGKRINKIESIGIVLTVHRYTPVECCDNYTFLRSGVGHFGTKTHVVTEVESFFFLAFIIW
jgi:hypothetical protein